MATLEWNKLLCTKRERESKSGSSINPVRNEFEADYDRIVGSSSVRRLQDKAQVFPLQQNDVARTRLTHSMEVSALARSLGKAVGRRLEEKEIFQDREQTEKLSALLQVAGLIHDLGNPPFGHYGETVIRDWFGTEQQEFPGRCQFLCPSECKHPLVPFRRTQQQSTCSQSQTGTNPPSTAKPERTNVTGTDPSRQQSGRSKAGKRTCRPFPATGGREQACQQKPVRSRSGNTLRPFGSPSVMATGLRNES